MTVAPALPDLAAVRAQFPALSPTPGEGLIYLDNAAGALVPARTAQAVAAHLTGFGSANAMPGHRLGRDIVALKERARAATALFLNARPGEVALGPSATALNFRLAAAFARLWGPDDEVVISELDHEADASPWRELARVGVTVRVWPVRDDITLHVDDLVPLLSPRTRLVAVTGASNAFGSRTPLLEAVEAAHAAGAWTMVDAVHLAAHELPDVAALPTDFLTFSPYKVFAPHLGALYVRGALLAELPVPKLEFVADDDVTKLEHGTPQYELHAGWLATLDYLRDLGGQDALNRAALEAAYARIAELERAPSERLLEGLLQHERVTLYGPQTPEARVGTFGFRVAGEAPEQTARRLSDAGVSVAAGHFYAVMPVRRAGLYPDGVVRASLAHYNGLEDVEALLEAL